LAAPRVRCSNATYMHVMPGPLGAAAVRQLEWSCRAADIQPNLWTSHTWTSNCYCCCCCCWCLQAAGLSISPTAAWTILAPTNKAWADDDLQEKTGLAVEQLMLPANRLKLVQVRTHITSHGVGIAICSHAGSSCRNIEQVFVASSSPPPKHRLLAVFAVTYMCACGRLLICPCSCCNTTSSPQQPYPPPSSCQASSSTQP
jgi:hypothetical protein